jgi:hypothetical protein
MSGTIKQLFSGIQKGNGESEVHTVNLLAPASPFRRIERAKSSEFLSENENHEFDSPLNFGVEKPTSFSFFNANRN